MAWIYFQELVESDSHSNLGSEQSPIVSVNPTHKAYFCHECNQVKLTLLQSGMMLQHSEAICCQGLTLSSEVSPVRISVLQDVEKAWQESEVVFSSRSSDLPESATLDLFSSKMSLPSEPVEGREWSKNWPRSGMTVDGQLFQPPQLEPHTKEIDGSCSPVPTPSASDSCRGPGKHYDPKSKRQSDRTLVTYAKKAPVWPTPTVCGNYQNKGNMVGLATAVKMWPTPCARDWKDNGKSPAELERNSTTLARIAGGQLNPQWVEWLMGYRTEYTELSASVTEWFHSKFGKRSRSSRGSKNV